MLTHPERTKEELVAWIRGYFEQNGPACSAESAFRAVRILAW